MIPLADHYPDILRRLREIERERAPEPERVVEAEQDEMDWVGSCW